MQKFCKYKKVYILKHITASNDAGGDCGNTGRERVLTGFWLGHLKNDHLEDLDVDGRIILKGILKK